MSETRSSCIYLLRSVTHVERTKASCSSSWLPGRKRARTCPKHHLTRITSIVKGMQIPHAYLKAAVRVRVRIASLCSTTEVLRLGLSTQVRS